MPATALRHPSPNPFPAAEHRQVAEFPEPRAKTHLLQRGQNFRSCSPKKAPKDDRLHHALAPQPAAPPNTAVRIRPCSPCQSVPTPSRKLPAPRARFQLGNNKFVAYAKGPPESSASFSRCRCQVLRHGSVRAAGPQFPARESVVVVHQPGSGRIPARGKSPQTMLNLPHHTNILTAARVARA